jgi:hypothetical protein
VRTRHQQRVRRLVSAASLALLLSVAAACGATQPSTRGVTLPPSDPGSTPGACMAAQTTGVLRTVGAGILGIREPSGRVLGLMLPSGYTVRDDAVLDNQGSAIAKVGDSIQVDGGEVKAGWWEVCAGSLVLLPAPSG